MPRQARRRDILTLALLLAAAGVIGYMAVTIRTLQAELTEAERLIPDAVRAGVRLLPLPGETLAGEPRIVQPGRAYVVFFMSPGCDACSEWLPAWRLIREQVGSDSSILLVPELSRDADAELLKYSSANDLPLDNALLISYMALQRFNMRGVPKMLLVAKDGKVAKVWQGLVEPQVIVSEWMAEASKRSS